jgi:hypothetical protein
MQQPTTSHIIKGCIIAVVLILFNLATEYTSLKNINWLVFVPSILLVSLALINVLHFAKQAGPNSFGNLFAFGFKTIAVATCIMFLYTLLSIKYFFPQIRQKAEQQTKEYVLQQPNILPGNVDTETKNAMKGYLPITLSMVIITTLVVGGVGSAIGAVLARTSTKQ